MNYRIEIAIDVTEKSAVAAAKRGWELLIQPDALLPVVTVTATDKKGDVIYQRNIDLQEIYDKEHSTK